MHLDAAAAAAVLDPIPESSNTILQ